MGYFSENLDWLDCADFFKLVNDWFDVLNVRVAESDSRGRVKAFGLDLETQIQILDQMSETINRIKILGQSKSYMLPFQKGILLTNSSCKQWYKDLKQKFNIKYVLTYRLNQDITEIFFSAIRSKGGLYDHPNPIEFKYRLRNYILGRNEGSLSEGGNTEVDSTPDGPVENVGESLLSADCFSILAEGEQDDYFNSRYDDVDDAMSNLKYDALEHLTGFISYKLKLDKPGTSKGETFTWTNQLSEGGLTKPSEELLSCTQDLEKIFNFVIGSTIKITTSYVKKLLDHSRLIKCSDKIKSLFFRSRMYF